MIPVNPSSYRLAVFYAEGQYTCSPEKYFMDFERNTLYIALFCRAEIGSIDKMVECGKVYRKYEMCKLKSRKVNHGMIKYDFFWSQNTAATSGIPLTTTTKASNRN